MNTSPLRVGLPRHRVGLILLYLAMPTSGSVSAQPRTAEPEAVGPVAPAGTPLTLEEAIELALTKSYVLQQARADIDVARAQVDQAWGLVHPQVNLRATYTRNLEVPNPFAGSDAGGFFGGLGAIEWLAFNENARTDGDVGTNPISLNEFFQRQADGRAAAGLGNGAGGNPFLVENSFRAGLSVTQVLYSAAAFAAIRGGGSVEEASTSAAERQSHQTIAEVSEAFYGALLAEARAEVLARSVARATESEQDIRLRVDRGLAPKFQLLSAEVQRANLDAQRITAEALAQDAVERLKLIIGLPMNEPIRVVGELRIGEAEMRPSPTRANALEQAERQRPDLRQAAIGVALQRTQVELDRSDYYPTLSLVGNLNLVGTVPDDRVVGRSVPGDPFTFEREERGVFDDEYWNREVNVQLVLNWNLYDGFQTTSRVEQARAGLMKVTSQQAQAQAAVALEVDAALRALASARERLAAQGRTVERAELSYQHAETRLKTGVATPIEVREASDQLDQSRLNALQAMHDLRVAQVRFDVAVGQPPVITKER